MSAVRPRALVHRGSVEAAGLFFDPELVGTGEARRRVLALWTPGAALYRAAGGLVLRLPAPLRVRCEQAPGLPLVAAGSSAGAPLLAAPLTPAELRALDPPPGSLVLVRGGLAVVEPLSEAAREEPATWLDVGEFVLVEAASLGSRPASARMVVEETPFDARRQIPGVPPPAPELAALLESLRLGAGQTGTPRQFRLRAVVEAVVGAAAGAGAVAGGALLALARAAGGLLSRLPGGGAAREAPARPVPSSGQAGGPQFDMPASPPWLTAMFGWLMAPLARLLGAGSDGGAAGGAGAANRAVAPPPKSAGPTASERLSALAHRLAARFLVLTRLSGLVGGRQARYVARMMEMFERGDLAQALRHAIPLGALPSDEPPVPGLGVPSPRADLSIHARLPRGGRVIGAMPAVHDMLESLYRRAFERLEAEDRIEEAAFVLAELLQASEEAVAFLERHGRLRLAAELAEGRGLPPGLVVRQWFLAGDVERAVAIARRTEAFGDAVLRLERSHREEAEALRCLWAAARAAGGDYAGAVDTIWPVREARHLALAWMDRVLEGGGIPAARMLAQKAALVPEALPAIRERAEALLADEAEEGARARQAFAEALRALPASSRTRALARPAARAAARDLALGYTPTSSADLRRLVEFTGDGALRADLLSWQALQAAAPAVPSLCTRPAPLELAIKAGDTGALPVLDAAFLPGGACIAALGEAGVRVLTRDGRTVVHLDQPAHRLVLSDRGDRAIALARRGRVWRLARLDFLTRRAESWCEAEVDAFAPDYDGSLWFVGTRDGFLAIDATARRFEALWRTRDLGGTLASIARSATQCSFLNVSRGDRDEWGRPAEPWERRQAWVYEIPSLVLRHRHELTPSTREREILAHAVSPGGRSASLGSPPPESGAVGGTALSLEIGGEAAALSPNGFLAPGLELAHAHSWVAVPVRTADGIRCHLVDVLQKTERARIFLGGSERCALRFTEMELALADDRGRLLILDLASGALLRDLRVR